MSRTNKSRSGWSHLWLRHLTWAKRHGNKGSRRVARQHLPAMGVSESDMLRADITADQLEERGALEQAMKIRKRDEPAFPGRSHDVWR